MPTPVASMTGSGMGTVDRPEGRFAVELRSVNHRFLKTTVRAGGPLPGLEPAVTTRLRRSVHRGHVTAHVRFVPTALPAAAAVDDEAFAAVAERLTALARQHELEEPSVADVLRLIGVQGEGPRDGADALLPPVLEALEGAIAELLDSRRREGALLAVEVGRLLDAIATGVEAVRGRAAEVPAAYRDRLHARLGELLEGSGFEPDAEQMAREVALLADRADVREEIARLGAHLAHAREVLGAGGPVGRRLDFLVQEMHRETSTIGSKVGDLGVARLVVDVKADVERLREQVQNLE